MYVAVDESGDHPPSADVHLLHLERAVQRRQVPADPDHRLAGYEEMAASLRSRIVELGVPDQRKRAAHVSLNPPTAPVSRSAASARWPAMVEISSVDAL